MKFSYIFYLFIYIYLSYVCHKSFVALIFGVIKFSVDL